MVLTLYTMEGSSASRVVLMVIEALNIPDVEYVNIDLRKGDHLKEEYTKINPQHTIPMLKDDEFYVWDSHAIAIYLITKYGKDDSLYPAEPCKRAVIDQRLHFDSGILFPTYRTAVCPIYFLGEKTFREENLEKVRRAYDFAEKLLISDWMVGDDVTLADICCVSTIRSMESALPVDKLEFPKLSAWLERCSQLEIYKKKNAPGLASYKSLMKTLME